MNCNIAWIANLEDIFYLNKCKLDVTISGSGQYQGITLGEDDQSIASIIISINYGSSK